MLNPIEKIDFYARVARILPSEDNPLSTAGAMHEVAQKIAALTAGDVKDAAKEDVKDLGAALFALFKLSVGGLKTILGSDELHALVDACASCGENHNGIHNLSDGDPAETMEQIKAMGDQPRENILVVEGMIDGNLVASGVALKRPGADNEAVQQGVMKEMEKALQKAFPNLKHTITLRPLRDGENVEDVANGIKEGMGKALGKRLIERLLGRNSAPEAAAAPFNFSNDEEFLGSMGIRNPGSKTGQA